MKIDNFDYFKVGTIFNPLILDGPVKPVNQKITILYPTRLNAMAIDPSKIVENHNMKYTPGEVVFSTRIFIEVSIELVDDNGIMVNEEMRDRETVIKHACLLMRKAFGYDKGMAVTIKNYHNLKHCGLGSTGCIQAGVAAAVNHLFGNPIPPEWLVRYLAQNYGEEIDGNADYLNPVQCIGGSAASGLYKGGVIVVAGENTVIAEGSIGEEYEVIIGIPEDYVFIDSNEQFENEKENLNSFLECGNKYKHEIAYNILHQFLPALYNRDVKVMGDVIWDYRYHKGSIKNCAYTYPELPELMERLASIRTENKADVLSVSSVGPAVFAITREAEYIVRRFSENKLKIVRTKIHNDRYVVKLLE